MIVEDRKRMAIGAWGIAAFLGTLYPLGRLGLWINKADEAFWGFPPDSSAAVWQVCFVGVTVVLGLGVVACGFCGLAVLAWTIGDAVYKEEEV